jgi:fermentation-respiration switch protein FrsA (DUF1100 family)
MTQKPAASGSEGRGRPRRRGILWPARLAGLALLSYIAVIVMLTFFENEMVYPGWRRTDGDWSPRGLDYEEVDFLSADGTRLHGWYLPAEDPSAWILYCHGNGDIVADCAWALDEVRQETGAAVFVFDYRGYGRSQGQPDEAGVVADAEAALDWLCRRADLQPDQVVLMGRSLGGAVAVQLAARHGARGLILERTFTTLPEVAANVFPWLPVRMLMRNRYDSLSCIGEYRGPLLQSHGTLDEIVPFHLGRRLHEASAAEPKTFVEMPGGYHNSPDSREYRQAFRDFLDQLP